MEFIKIPPITINQPIKLTFDEAFISSDIRLHYFRTVSESVYTYTSQDENQLLLFVIREFLQNAIDNEIQKTLDFLNAYRNVKLDYENGYYVIRSEGAISEEAFELGFTTKTTQTKPPCCLIGKFGVGLKQAMGTMLLIGKTALVLTDNHAYMFAGYCNGTIKIKDVDDMCRLVVLRGKAETKGQTTVYVEGKKLDIDLLWKGKTQVLKEGRNVYHNGMYSGKWDLPFSVNLCCVYADQYRTKVNPYNSTLYEQLGKLSNEDKELIKEAIIENGKKEGNAFLFNFPGDYSPIMVELNDVFADAIISIAKAFDVKPIIVGSLKEIIMIGNGFGFNIQYDYIFETVVNRIRKKGYEAFTAKEYSQNRDIMILLNNSYKFAELPDDIKKGVLAGLWAFNTVLAFLGITNDYAILDYKLQKIPLFVLKDSYAYQTSDLLGITKFAEKPYIFLSPPRIMAKIEAPELGMAEKDTLETLYMIATFHEYIHAYFEIHEHGTYSFERPYVTLLQIIQREGIYLTFLENVLNLAHENPTLLEDVTRILGLDNYIFDRTIFQIAKPGTHIPVKIEGVRVEIATEEDKEYTLTIEKEDDLLSFQLST
ncbi:putative ATPase VP1 [Sulfolobus filamentous virus 1]|uniref:Putative ATPase VP1 n=1 Tax=Sulfolobus filamentous virus 1 TaxID=2304198 RepID=A0A346LU50_SUFV1|nr:putative ATPase VP1 [Sulfolobus filamentous virus 1]AXQ00093.1 putative ATPase VP1 [Sulfolobus filamentous virus 1]